ncbi:hypothetical protein [Paenibacillus faecalis]|uniref:hypothetical protein n=1 Tax=Paenibacillus faecalis TaxID=2079532 RepID=UPI000D10CC19|nr:hypothetical protein [Paenibacillus faecalis]
MNHVCGEKLLKCIQSVHVAIMAYANCLCIDGTEEDQEIFFKFGEELSLQLKELRQLYISLYQFDPLDGYPPIQTN